MEGSPPTTTVAKRLWHIVRVLYYMFRKGISKRRLMVDLHLLLKRGKIAGKAIGNLMFHHHTTTSTTTTTNSTQTNTTSVGDNNSYYSAFSCRSMDPNLSFYTPREVEFSCCSTPSYPSFHITKRKKNRRRHKNDVDLEVAAIKKAFELLNSEIKESPSDEDNTPVSGAAVAATPSPLPFWSFGKSPMVVRQLRITDSPFPIREEEEEDGCRVDEEAAEFIQRFYEQLRQQQRVAAMEA